MKCDCCPSYIGKILHFNRSDQPLYGPPFHVPFTKIMLYWPVPIGSHFKEINCLLIAHSRNKTLQFYFWTQLFLAAPLVMNDQQKNWANEFDGWLFISHAEKIKRDGKETSERAVMSIISQVFYRWNQMINLLLSSKVLRSDANLRCNSRW